MLKRTHLLPFLALAITAAACGHARKPYATTGGALQLSKVVLYRNGVGYFERGGTVSGEMFTIRVRKDQVNDLLKSLTVVERKGGRAVSISMPLDPRAWANAAIATLGPGSGSLAEVLDKLRGTEVTLRTSDGDSMRGRVLIVEVIQPDGSRPSNEDGEHQLDYKVTLIHEDRLSVVKLSKVAGIVLHNDDISMQFQRSLDATAGEGMFQQVDVTIRLAGAHTHDLLVSYVVGAPMWKPTYRVVLPEKGKGQALLQGWAVVDNTTGEDWRDVKLSLTSGAPIAFRYDLHTPRDVTRTDLSAVGSTRRAQASIGEAGYAQPGDAAPAAPVTASAERFKDSDAKISSSGAGRSVASPKKAPPRAAPMPATKSIADKNMPASQPAPDVWGGVNDESAAVDAEELARSMQPNTKAANVSGLSRYDLGESLTVPDGTSTMVAIINQQVDGEETFLFKPGGGGPGYETNPYRVIRFKNSTPFALESGPISIYSGGSFVGEGISEPVSAGVAVTIPFAVESSFLVSSHSQYNGDEIRLVKIVRGVMEIESFGRRTTTWEVKSQLPRPEDTTLYVRHQKMGGSYELTPRPPATEDLPDAYLIQLKLPAKATETKLDVVEQTPSRSTLSIWESRALVLLEGILAQGNLDAGIRAKLDPIVKLRQEVGRIDTEIEGKTRTRGELDQRANETRANLEAIKKDPAAGALRKRLSDRLEQFAKDGDKLGREIVELSTKRTEKKIALEDAMQNLDLNPKQPLSPKK
ncbi:MAG: DUF4139 domain-containing protein [Myxococcales bacterium]|nr:DUF4139 domain-containing protein [Myxococcales bacterium]